MKTVAYYLMLACTAGVLAGCGGGESGPTNYPVSGKVTVDGEPLAEGDIIFRDAELYKWMKTKVKRQGVNGATTKNP